MCVICSRPTVSPYIPYCTRCRDFFAPNREQMKRREALKTAYDRENDGFRCHLSGVLLEERDINDPYHLFFDHLIPVKASKLVACASVFNSMKNQLGPDEFRLAVHELAAHRAGKPFDRGRIEFRYWRLKAPAPRAAPPGAIGNVNVPECVVCGGPPKKWSYYCKRCLRFVWMHRGDQRIRAKALREAWDPRGGHFVCHYTGAWVSEDDPSNPWFLTFDHRVPGDRGSTVVAAWWVNAMKTALSEEEFWKVVGELDRCWREGGEFERDICEFRFWRRKPRKLA
jgi:hypothetical protein